MWVVLSTPIRTGTSAAEDRLQALRARCTAWLLPYTLDYVWNKDPLVLRASSRQAPPWERRRGIGDGKRRHHDGGVWSAWGWAYVGCFEEWLNGVAHAVVIRWHMIRPATAG
jgi:hypothetical protein